MFYRSLLFLSFATTTAFADVPHTFSAGDPVDADKFNENFSTLDQRIDDLVSSRAAEATQSPKRVRRLVTTDNVYRFQQPDLPAFENTENLSNLVVLRVLQTGCDSDRFKGLLIDDTHTVLGGFGAAFNYNIGFGSKVTEFCSRTTSGSNTSRQVTIEIEYDE